MKLPSLLFLLLLFFGTAKAQYLIIGKDSLSVEAFKKENSYGLENLGVEQTIKTYLDFKLLQQFAIDKKADTMSYFKKRIYDKEKELREASFYPPHLIQNALADYLSAHQTEDKIQIFYLEKNKNTALDFQKIYQEVISGKITMDDAMVLYAKQQKSEGFYVKSGSVDRALDRELKKLNKGEYTSLINTPQRVVFAKLVDRRPSLGYLVFGTISFAKNEAAEKTKKQIIEALQSGQKFEEVARLYGSTDNEKKNAGVVMGSPILPEKVYQALKGKKEGEYTEPILVGDQYYIFNIYSLIPYQDSQKYHEMFVKEMMNSSYAEEIYQDLIQYLKESAAYKEFPAFNPIQKSFQAFQNFNDSSAPLYQYGKTVFRYEELKKDIQDSFKDRLPPTSEQWTSFIISKRDNDLFALYAKDFMNRKEIQEKLSELKKNLLSDYVYSYWVENQLEKQPQLLDEYFEAHKDQFRLESTAVARVVIVYDVNLKKEMMSLMEDPKNWESLQQKYREKTNSKNQLLARFESGEMSSKAEVFTRYGVPLKKGLHEVKIQDQLLLIAIDQLLPERSMTREEATVPLKNLVTEALIQKAVEEQRNKTKIVIEPLFLKTLNQYFKK